MLPLLQNLGNGLLTGTLFEKWPKTDSERRARIEKMFEKYKRLKFSNVENETSDSLMKRNEAINDGIVLLIDCREKKERLISTIEGSIFKDDVNNEILNQFDEIICFCTIGYRSGVFCKELMDRYLEKKIFNLKGGILLWCHDGGKVITLENEPIKKVHVYGQPWDLLPQEFEAIY